MVHADTPAEPRCRELASFDRPINSTRRTAARSRDLLRSEQTPFLAAPETDAAQRSAPTKLAPSRAANRNPSITVLSKACSAAGLRSVPEACTEGAFDRGSRVAALVGDVTNGVFLLQGVPSRQRSKPLAGARECGTTRLVRRRLGLSPLISSRARQPMAHSASSTSARNRVDPVRLDERVGILRVGEDVRARARAEPARRLDRVIASTARETPSRPGASLSKASTTVVEAQPPKSRDHVRLERARRRRQRRSGIRLTEACGRRSGLRRARARAGPPAASGAPRTGRTAAAQSGSRPRR